MWYINGEEAVRAGFKTISKNHRKEAASCFANFKKILSILKDGNKLTEFKVGFFRPEGNGLYRIGQTKVKDSKEVRIYVYPDTENEIIYILSMGTKESQQKDIREAKKKIATIKKRTQEKNQ